MAPSPAHRWFALTLAGFTCGVGCQETVALGSECLPFGESCGGADDDDGVSAREAGAGSVLAIENPSFELTRGDGGEIAPLVESAIAPWYTCRTGLSVTGELTSDAQQIEPRTGQALVSVSFPFRAFAGTELYQHLEPPLRRDEPYAFRLDVRSASGGQNNLTLEVWGARASCLPIERLFESPELADERGWSSLCVRFVPGQELDELVLSARAAGGAASDARLYFDDLRQTADCR